MAALNSAAAWTKTTVARENGLREVDDEVEQGLQCLDTLPSIRVGECTCNSRQLLFYLEPIALLESIDHRIDPVHFRFSRSEKEPIAWFFQSSIGNCKLWLASTVVRRAGLMPD